MVFLSFLRIIKFSFQDIYRNIWLSIVTITILILALFSINLLLAVRVISETAISAVKDKIDVSLYLKPDAADEEIMALKGQVSNLSQVKEVNYISKAQALEFFQEKNKDNPEILQALQELGKNPLTPSLVITPKSAEVANELIGELNKIESDLIESQNFSDNQLLLDKINSLTDKINEIGMIISLIFIFSTLLVVYNAVRVEIYTHREEIGIMRLVGASNSFVHMPFLLSSLIYTLIGTVAAVFIFYPFLSLLQPYLANFFAGYNINVISYFSSNFIKIFGLEFLAVALINALASWMAVRRYSKV
ncbi:MAG: permease-like cell division protein FtsX [Patescibacteria group bacterium]|nr:permease-like cell division protein FtsX [Patescibacteria group bacterium]MDD5294854.1 permease-like cell division protein FtsX [Patescibacteria group bacterium]MDD5554742.1 permease-like cell division protein FtsX [Patescibacteria group bacterium]